MMRWVEKRHKWAIDRDGALVAQCVLQSSDDPRRRYETKLFRTRAQARDFQGCVSGNSRIVKVLPYYVEMVREPAHPGRE
jgi:hypothetical protein